MLFCLQMESPVRFASAPKPCSVRGVSETELGELRAVATSTANSPTATDAGVPCHNGACKSSGDKLRPEHHIESPWHHLKSLFLVSIIVALVVWIFVYVMLTQFDVL